jgi:hypothetical protein
MAAVVSCLPGLEGNEVREPTPPIILVEGHDVAIFESLEDACAHVELPDIKENVYRAYDAEGRLLSLEVEAEKPRISATEDEPGHLHELELLLNEFLTLVHAGPPVAPNSGISALIVAAKGSVRRVGKRSHVEN